MKKHIITMHIIVLFFATLLPMQPNNDAPLYHPITIQNAPIPHYFSPQSTIFCKTHLLLTHLEEHWNELPISAWMNIGQQLEAYIAPNHDELVQEALTALINLFLYHRPFNLTKAITLINNIFTASPTLLAAVENQLEQKKINRTLWHDTKPHQKIILLFFTQNEQFAQNINQEFITKALSWDIIEKLVIGFNLIKMNPRNTSFFTYRIITHNDEYFFLLEMLTNILANKNKTAYPMYLKNYLDKIIKPLASTSFELEKIFFYDDLNALKMLLTNENINIESKNPLTHWNLSLNQIAALAGALDIFKYISLWQLPPQPISPRSNPIPLITFALYGNNYEIIHLCQETLPTPENEAIFILNEAIRWHKITLINYLLPTMPRNYASILNTAVFYKNIPCFLWYLATDIPHKPQHLNNAFCEIGTHDGLLFAHIFLEMKIDPNALAYNGTTTPFLSAIENKNIPLTNLLIKHGASGSILCNNRGAWHIIPDLIHFYENLSRTDLPFSIYIEKNDKLNQDIIFPLCALLKEAQAPLTMQDEEGNTIFHLLANGCNRNTIKHLCCLYNISTKAPVFKIHNRYGVTASTLIHHLDYCY